MTTTGRRRRTAHAGDLSRATGAVLILTAVIVGLPLLLTTVAGTPIPSHLPSASAVATALTSRDNGQLFLDCLLILAWASWAVFTLCTGLETIAQLRGRPTLRLPGLRAPQHLAGHLVTAITVALIGTIPSTAPAIAHRPHLTLAAATISNLAPPAAPTPTIATGPATTRESSTAPTTPQRGHPTYTVRRGDTLWGIAAEHLGNPERYHEIAQLNYHRPQPDGRELRNDHWIYPGWTLLLPHDATDLPPDDHHQQAPPRPHRSAPRPGLTPSPAPTVAPEAAPPPRATTRPATVEHESPDTQHAAADWLEFPVLPAAVAVGLAAALAVARLRRRRRYQPTPPATSLARPQPADRLHRLASTSRGADLDSDPVDERLLPSHPVAASRDDPLHLVILGRRDQCRVTLDLLAHPALAIAGPGGPAVVRAILTSLLARARPYDVTITTDPAAHRALLAATAPIADTLTCASDVDAVITDLAAAHLTRTRLLQHADDDYLSYRDSHPDEPLPLHVFVFGSPVTDAAGQLEALMADGPPLGITVLFLGEVALPDMATIEVDVDGHPGRVEPSELARRLTDAHLYGLSAADATTAWSALGDVTARWPTPRERSESISHAAVPGEGDTAPAHRSPSAAATGAVRGRSDQIDVQILGPTQIIAWGKEVASGLRGSARELLTYYLCQPDGATADAAIEALWPDIDPDRGRQRFWTALGNLRSRLRAPAGTSTGQIIAKYGDHYRADPSALTVDLWQFHAALTDAQHAAGDPAAETAALRRAADIYRGDLAEGTDYLWIEPVREDLHRRALDCLVRLADLNHDSDLALAISTLERAISLDPYAEEVYRRLIVLHREADRPDAARRCYQQLQDRLEDLDAEPDASTRSLIRERSGQSLPGPGTVSTR